MCLVYLSYLCPALACQQLETPPVEPPPPPPDLTPAELAALMLARKVKEQEEADAARKIMQAEMQALHLRKRELSVALMFPGVSGAGRHEQGQGASTTVFKVLQTHHTGRDVGVAPGEAGTLRCLDVPRGDWCKRTQSGQGGQHQGDAGSRCARGARWWWISRSCRTNQADAGITLEGTAASHRLNVQTGKMSLQPVLSSQHTEGNRHT